MQPSDTSPFEGDRVTEPERGDPFTTGDAMLARAHSVARRIAERVRRVLADTRTDYPALPADPTDDTMPVESVRGAGGERPR